MPELTPEDCRDRFGSADRAVLGTAGADGVPHLVPVTFALLRVAAGDDVVVTAVDHKPKRTTRLRRLRNIVEQPAVTLLVDHYRSDWTALWWVRVDAVAEVLDGGERHHAASAALLARYPQYRAQPPTGPVIWAAVVRWTGWTGSIPGSIPGSTGSTAGVPTLP